MRPSRDHIRRSYLGIILETDNESPLHERVPATIAPGGENLMNESRGHLLKDVSVNTYARFCLPITISFISDRRSNSLFTDLFCAMFFFFPPAQTNFRLSKAAIYPREIESRTDVP